MSVSNHDGKWTCSRHGEFEGPNETIGMLLNTSQSNAPSQDKFVQAQVWAECPTCKDIATKDLCRECERHPASIDFCEGTIAYIHGFYTRICRCCYLKEIEKTLKTAMRNRDAILADIQANPCEAGEPA